MSEGTWIGRLRIMDIATFRDYIKNGILRPWDTDPLLREGHDKRIAIIRKIKDLDERMKLFAQEYNNEGRI